MADYIMRGTRNLITYAKSLAAVNMSTIRTQLAGIGGGILPQMLLEGAGVDGPQFVSRRYSEPEAQAIAGLLGVTVANVTTNGGQEIVG